MDKNLTIGHYMGLTSVKEHIQIKNEEMETYTPCKRKLKTNRVKYAYVRQKRL